MSWRPAVLGVIAFAPAACVAGRGSFDPQLMSGIGGRDVLFAADLVKSHASTVYDAILEIRPDFLNRRVPVNVFGHAQRLHVFLNGVDMGDLEALHALPLGPVTSVRYVSPGDAEFHWTHGTSGAAIVVTTRSD